ncbi:GlsB/YeaQ/YmgE family stress response membrane protein [Actinosynnema sp. CS-041913]|uniref:GlsB/YeaQ/YmgE family stress response membrane protein n=1 Tax=Actinosynnema sp. CS-041913 TaxID=3239917 RepID=UPI003D93198D
MEITGIISALFIGVLTGGLGRLVVPGKQRISLLMTMLVGIAAALVGTFAASVIGVSDTGGIDWIELALQVGLAGVGVAILSGRSKIRQHQ